MGYMPQIDDTHLDIIKYFLQKEEGWAISSIEKKDIRILTYNFPNSLLCISLASTESSWGWVDIKLNSQEHLRISDDYDIFKEIYTCDEGAYEMFHKKYKKLKTSWTTDFDYGSFSDIFKELWNSTIGYIRQ